MEKENLIEGPATDVQTRHLILQQVRIGQDARRESFDEVLDRLAGEFDEYDDAAQRKPVPEVAKATSAQIKEALEQRGGAFIHTAEYYSAIEDEGERMAAYTDLALSRFVPDGDEAEVRNNPFKFLGIPDTADFGQLRSTWLHLNRIWHPDAITPDDAVQFRLIFGGGAAFPIEDLGAKQWFDEFLKFAPPEVKEVEEVEKMTPEEQAEYAAAREAHRKKEAEYKLVKEAMIRHAHDKISLINRAYKIAKDRFSKEDQERYAGYAWGNGKLSGEIADIGDLRYDFLELEGGAQIRRNKGRFTSNSDPYLAFDMGDLYMADEHDYRQFIELQGFFAWMELQQMRTLSSGLLRNVIAKYKLNADQAEQLRLMITNRETLDFICSALNLDIKQSTSYYLMHFLGLVYDGPTYAHLIGLRDFEDYPLGVELTPDDGLILRYHAQIHQAYSPASRPNQTQLTPTDVKVMRSIAYGPMLES